MLVMVGRWGGGEAGVVWGGEAVWVGAGDGGAVCEVWRVWGEVEDYCYFEEGEEEGGVVG